MQPSYNSLDVFSKATLLLCNKIDALNNKFDTRREFKCKPNREKSVKRDASPNPNAGDFFLSQFCYYHRNYKDKAKKCIAPFLLFKEGNQTNLNSV